MGSSATVIPLFIGGKEEAGASTFDVTDPSTGEVCWNVASASEKDAVRAVEAAQAAFPVWAATKPFARQAVLFKAAALMEERAAELVGYMRTEMGADKWTGSEFLLPLAIGMMRDIAGRISDVCGSVPVVQAQGQSAMVWKEPYGVTLGIVPWNAPYVFGVRSAATAIATGNSTILKSSELTPRSYFALVKLLHDAGVPPGVVNVVSCKPADAPGVVNAMIAHPAVKKINFTGSASTGRKVAQECSRNLKPILLELGGKNSAIVLPDADLQKAARECLIGAFANSGQVCMSTDNIMIHKDIATEFKQALKQTLTAMQESSPELPLVVTSASAARIASVIEDATQKGGELFHGAMLPKGGKTGQVIPTVISGLSKDMELWKEEVFGPVTGFMTFEDEDKAVEIANSTGYGLSASVFTRDLRKGFAIAKKLESGAVHINSMTVHDETALPFGGVKNSGWGRFNAKDGMEEFLATKTVTWDD